MVAHTPNRRTGSFLGLILLLAPLAGCHPPENVERAQSYPEPAVLAVAPMDGPIAQKAEPKPPRNQPVSSGRAAESTNLLRLPAAVLQTTTAPANERSGLKALTDGNPSTVATVTAAPLDLVFSFGGATMTAERLVVTLPNEAKPGAAAANVEVLVSTVSASAGFRSLRVDPLKTQPRVQEFTFQPAAARWVLLRFTPAAGAKGVALAEVAVLGREGAPANRYAFNQSPARTLDVLARLKKVSAVNIAVSSDETSLFEDACDGRLDKWSFAEAALMASGVRERERRKTYLTRIDALETEARKAVAGAKTPYEKGEKLLRWLHAGPLAKGYASGQTDLSVTLDNRTFNCVSSAVLYNVLGRRLGLDVRAVEVPDHAFAILYDGTRHADVETTNAAGFNPARDKASQEALRKTIGFAYIPDKHRDKRREVREVGLVGMIYYNHGVELMKGKRFHEALLAYFRALNLDPESPSAVKNALAVLVNWSNELARAGKFEEAVHVLAVGLELAPRDAPLLPNRKAAWSTWAESAVKAGRDDEAVAILQKAAAAVPDEAARFREWLEGHVYRMVRKQHDAGNFAEALKTLERHGKLLTDPAKVRSLTLAVYDAWVKRLRDAKDWDGAAGVYKTALGRFPKDEHVQHNLSVAVQDGAWDLYQTQGADKAREFLRRMLERFPDVDKVKDRAHNHVLRVVNPLSDAGKWEEALAVVQSHKHLLRDEAQATRLLASVYDRWARAHVDRKDWAGAIAIYEKGLQLIPDNLVLKNNLEVCRQRMKG